MSTARKRKPQIRDPSVPRRRILWKTITVYSGTYRARHGEKIVIRRSLNPLPKTRVFRGAGGLKKYKLVKQRSSTREVVIVAKAAKKSKKEIEDEELEDLAALEDLDDLDEDEDEDEDETVEEVDEDEDDDEEEEEAPKKKKSKSKAKVERDFVGTQEIAEKAGVDSRTLRMVLRKHNIAKDEDSGQYRWASFNDKTVKKILKLLEGGAAEQVKKEGLDKLKASKAAEKAASSKKGKKGKKKKVVEDDDE